MTQLCHMRLLLVVADAGERRWLEESLDRAGHGDIVGTGDLTCAHRLCIADRPDLVLVEADVPELSRHALAELHRLTGPPAHLPVIALTAELAPSARRWALELGVHDFVARPVDEAELLMRVRNALRARLLQHQLKDRDEILSEALHERRSELDTVRESLSVLAGIAEYHDDDTSQHAERVGTGAGLIAQALELPDSFVAMIRDAAPLHDIGKVGISRRILLKPDRLTPAEWMHMMRHVEIGARLLASAQSPVLRLAGEIARTHHERWDGSGYLAGLAGQDIPIAGRITAVADVWDTLTHPRPYGPAWDQDRALAEIAAQAGAQFDPRVVDAFGSIDWRELDASLGSEPAQLTL